MTGDSRRGRPGGPGGSSDALDPYATLGLPRGAPLSEVKRAYRRLAKAFHPDSAGAEALPRFLAIHAAYEQIRTGRVLPGASRSTATPAAPREPWRADPARARATRRGAAADGANRARTRPPERDGGETEPGGTSRRQRRQATRKATLGSTSYDEARDRADATWSGASWYGPTTGEYWIINPREYADPRKHGPAYQARVRQGLAETAAREAGADGVTADEAAADEAAADEAGANEAVAEEPQDGPASGGATTGNWRGRTETVRRRPPVRNDQEQAEIVTGEVARGAWPAREPIVDPPARARWPSVDDRVDGPGRRFRPALIAWPPLGVAAAMALGDITGCAVYAASCTGAAPLLPWLAQAVILALLLLLPRLARLLAVGTVAVLLALVPATAVLLVLGAAGHPQAAFALGSLLALAWLAGVLVGAVSAVRGAPLFSAR